jgi:hypothetical protein
MSDRRVPSPGKIFFFRPILFPNDCFGAVLNITEAATFSSKPTKSHAARPDRATPCTSQNVFFGRNKGYDISEQTTDAK